jgi:Uma2 family endonuclease
LHTLGLAWITTSAPARRAGTVSSRTTQVKHFQLLLLSSNPLFYAVSRDDGRTGGIVLTYAVAMVTVRDPGVRRWTVDEYERLVTLLDLDRVELIDGVVYDVAPEGFGHSNMAMVVRDQLKERQPTRLVMAAGSVRLDNGSLWNPDVYVLGVPAAEVSDTYPKASEVLLAVEVSVSTWHRDTKRKLPVYARNGIPEVWVLRPTSGTAWELLRCTEPGPEGYRSTATISLPDGPASIPAELWNTSC